MFYNVLLSVPLSYQNAIIFFFFFKQNLNQRCFVPFHPLAHSLMVLCDNCEKSAYRNSPSSSWLLVKRRLLVKGY